MDSQDWRPIESFRTDPDVIFKEIHGYWPPLNTQVRRYFRTYQLEIVSVALHYYTYVHSFNFDFLTKQERPYGHTNQMSTYCSLRVWTLLV